MIVVDQLGENLLERYDSLYTGGFHRLLADGHVFRRASHDHFATKTAVGHATLSTGAYPSRHGIIANEWQEEADGGWVTISNVGDSSTHIVGQPRLAGVSPHYLERTGLADWMIAANPASQIASVSGKDRGAVLPAAQRGALEGAGVLVRELRGTVRDVHVLPPGVSGVGRAIQRP